jgi:hypothetical protein
MTEEWGPFIEHDGEPHPELNGHFAEVVCENGRCEQGLIECAHRPPPGFHTPFVWSSMPAWRLALGDAIIRYRLRKPQALLDLIRMAKDPTPVTPP